MTDNEYELARHCIDIEEFVTIQISDRYLLFHENVLNSQLDLESPSIFIRNLFHSNSLPIEDARITSHVDPSLYDIIIFADKSAVHTRRGIPKMKSLPYYVQEDLELLQRIGMSKEKIDVFVKKLDANDNRELLKHERIIQKIIDWSDISTRLKCRQVSKQWKNLVDNSTSWNRVKLSKSCRSLHRALNYFQHVDIRELDLSQSFFEPFEFHEDFHVYSLRSLCISTDHPLELFTILFRISPFLQHIQLIQTYNSSLQLKNNNQLYECINFVICQCQERLKCLRRLHIQLRSISDQIFLQSSSVTSIPVSYEVINC